MEGWVAENSSSSHSPQEVMRWLVVALVFFLYVHLFNALAQIPNLTLGSLWSRFFPPISIAIGENRL